MANSYTQILIQIVFVVKGRENLISESNREELEKYICGIITNNKCKALAIYCNPDHTHVLIGFSPDISVSKIAQLIKANSSKFINEQNWISSKFQWQSGFGAFSYSKSHLNRVVQYIRNQPAHHSKKSFKEEYKEFLERFDIDYDDRYLFD